MGDKKLSEKIYETIDFLNEVDDLEKNSREKISESDNRIQDLMHYLENNKLKNYEYIRFAVELKRVRDERRENKNELALINEFKKNMLQLQSEKGREALKNIIKRQEKLNNGKYHNRIYKQEELDFLIKKEG